MLVFQVDLWSTRGKVPRNMMEVQDRQKEINYSSRTRAVTDTHRRVLELRRAIAEIADRLPETVRQDPALQDYLALGDRRCVDIVQLIYKRKNYESQAKDYQFSRASMRDHWRDGYKDITREMKTPGWLESNETGGDVRVFDPY